VDDSDLTPSADREPRLRAHVGLVLICVVPAVLETALVARFGPPSALPLAPQTTAAAPFGVFHDLRWLLVYAHSWWTLAGETVGFLVVRTALTAATVRLAWPRDVEAVPVRTLVRRALGFTVAAAILLSWSASLLVGLAVAPVSYLFFAAVPLAFILALLLHHGPVLPWWRTHPSLRTAGWTAATFVILTLGGAVMVASPWWLHLPIAAAVGLFNAWAWLAVVRSLAARDRVRFVPLAPVGLAALIAVVLGGVTIGISVANSHGRLPREHGRASPGQPGTQPVLVLTGFASSWLGGDSDRLALGPGFDQRRFSYAGLGADGRPLPYDADDTDQPLPVLVHRLDVQVRALATERHARLDLVSDSEGALVAKAYLESHPEAPVKTLVLTSPLVEPGRAYLPPHGHTGYGFAATWSLRGIGWTIRQISSLDVSPDGPFLTSIGAHAPELRNSLECRLPNTAQLALFPLADAVGAPYGGTDSIPAAVLPAFHGTLFEQGSALRIIGDYLRTGAVPGYSGYRRAERLLRAAAAAWQVPTLRPTLNPAWRSTVSADVSCRASASALTRWLG
jgi:hypothetical protein